MLRDQVNQIGTIYFVVPAIPEPLRSLLADNRSLPEPEILAPDTPPARGCQWSWIIQTFLYMKQAGLDVALVEQPVKNAVCVTHFATTKNQVWGADSFVVGVRGDNSPLRMREIELVQSPANLGGQDVFLMQHWPQPRLIPRDRVRGDRIEHISYFGGNGGFSPAFRSSAFIKALKDMGVELTICSDSRKWNDYRKTDLVLAVRDNLHPLLLETKPASKLVNAWKAQCVALLGKEPAFRAIGRSGEDYFEVNSPQDVLDIVAHLKENPALYQRVRQHGSERYAEFSFEMLQQQWIELLTGTVAESFVRWQKGMGSSASVRRTRRYWQATRQWIDHKLFFLPVRAQQLFERQFGRTQFKN